MAMTYEMEVGWVADKLGSNSGHWKRKAQAGRGNKNREETDPFLRKIEGPTPLNELDQNIREAKHKKGENQVKENAEKGIVRDGGCYEATPLSPMTILAWNCQGLGSALAVRALTNEVKECDPMLVFLVETKANQNRIKGLQRKLGLIQGITVSCDGRSGGLAMLWKEGVDECFKSCLNTHIDVVVCEGNGAQPWRATGFYGHPDVGMRPISQNLLESLTRECHMPWVVFRDFNEILNSDEKLGWQQMRSG